MKVIKYLMIILFFTSLENYPQAVHKIPFGSKNNIIELGIVNETGENLNGIVVEIKSKPEWIKIEDVKSNIGEIKSGEEKSAEIIFSIDKKAELEKEEAIKIEIRNSEGVMEEKEIKFLVSHPKEYILEQNYPNPFNPKTKIGYQVPEESKVELKVYDILGREVEILNNEIMKPGYYEIEFNGERLPSGIYIYSLISNGFRANKKMLLLK